MLLGFVRDLQLAARPHTSSVAPLTKCTLKWRCRLRRRCEPASLWRMSARKWQCARVQLDRVGLAGTALRLVLAILGCGVASTAWSACGKSDADGIHIDNLLLAEGEFYQLDWGGAQLDRFYVTARAGTPQEPSQKAVLVSADRAEPCELGSQLTRYFPLRPLSSSQYVIGAPSPARVPLLEATDEQGYGTLSFADVECKRTGPTLSGVKSTALWSMYSPDMTAVTFAALTQDGDFRLVDPWGDAQRRVASDVTQVATFDTGSWSIEQGALVQRDREGQRLQQLGTGVQEFALLSSNEAVAYADGQGVHVLQEGEEQLIAQAGCGLHNLEAFASGAIAYFEPCAARKLHVRMADGRSFDYADGVQAVIASSDFFLYTTLTSADASKMRLWLVKSDAPDTVISLGERPAFSVKYVLWAQAGAVLLLAQQSDGTTSVWQFFPAAQFPSLVELTKNIIGYQFVSEGVALLYADGELVVLDPSLQQVVLDLANARNSRFLFVLRGKAAGVAYLDEVDPDTRLGRLELQLMNGQHYSLAPDVREFTEVWWPESGVVYARGGEQAGIYFARLEVPCEVTSDTAWACGF